MAWADASRAVGSDSAQMTDEGGSAASQLDGVLVDGAFSSGQTSDFGEDNERPADIEDSDGAVVDSGMNDPEHAGVSRGLPADSEDDSDVVLAQSMERAAYAKVPAVASIASTLKGSRVMDVPAASSANGAAMQLYDNNTTAAQRFKLRALGGGYYSIINVNSGKALDVRNGVARKGAPVQQFAANGTDAQAWKFVATGDADGSYYIVSKLKSSLVLDVSGANAANGSKLQVYTLNKTAAQKFVLKTYAQTVSSGTYTLQSGAAKTVLDIAGASWSNGANAQMYKGNGTSAQDFAVTYDGSTGYYTIGTFATGKVLDVASAGAYPGANVQQYAANGTSAQKWTIEKSKGSGYVVRSACSGLALDVAGASTANGANVQVYAENGSAAQAWTFGNPATVSLEGLFTFRAAANNDYAIDIASASNANCANVQLYRSNGTWAQRFEVEMVGSYCVIRSLQSGKVLDAAAAGTANGTNVQQYEYNGSDAQLWRVVQYDGSTYGFQSKCNGLYLDVSSGKMENGTNIQVWSGNGTQSQRFVLKKTDRSTSVTEGSYVLRSVADGTAIDMLGAGTSNGTKAQLYAANGTYAQKFKVLSAGSGSYCFANVHSSKYLDVDTSTNSIVQQWDRSGGANQKWTFSGVSGSTGAYCVKSVSTGLYLTNDNGSLRLAKYTGTASQQFRLEHTDAFKVYLDAGHGWNSNGGGGLDVGAVSLGYRECDLTSDLVSRIASQLDRLGIEYYIGSGKAYWDRHQDAINMGCSTFLSIHFNSGGGWGTESYIHSYNAARGSATYQSIMHPYLIQGTGLKDRGRKAEAFAVCGGKLPSMLCEIAFIDSASDMNTYQSRKDVVAAKLAQGLKQASGNAACGWY